MSNPSAEANTGQSTAGDLPSPRGAARRAAIVAAASELFARSGYAAVGMDAIGAVAGVTGPAIYRHFSSKSAVLAAVFEVVLDAVQTDSGRDRGAAGSLTGSPREELRRAVDLYSRSVTAHRSHLAVFVREIHQLTGDESVRLRERQRDLVGRWRTLLAAVHPHWSAEQVRTAVHAAFGVLNAVGTFSSPLSDAELADLLGRHASSVLQVDLELGS